MTYTNIIELLKKHKVITSTAFVAVSCESAWEEYKEDILGKHPDMTFNKFCDIANDMWIDCEDSTGLSTIADWVAEWLIDHDEAPDYYSELYDECGY